MVSLGPRGLIGRIYVRDHYTLLHTKYIRCGPYGFRKEEFLSCFISMVSVWELMTPWGMVNMGPRGLIGRIYVGDH